MKRGPFLKGRYVGGRLLTFEVYSVPMAAFSGMDNWTTWEAMFEEEGSNKNTIGQH